MATNQGVSFKSAAPLHIEKNQGKAADLK